MSEYHSPQDLQNMWESAYAQGCKETLEKAILEDGNYCWQVCCETEMCQHCDRLNNGDIDYFDNTFGSGVNE